MTDRPPVSEKPTCESCGGTREVYTDNGWGTCPDCRPPVSGEPSTGAALAVLRHVIGDMLDMNSTPRVREWRSKLISARDLLAEARATPPSLDVPTLAESIDFHIETSCPRDTACDGTCAEDIAEHYASRLTSKEER